MMMIMMMVMEAGNEGCGWCLISCCFPWVALSIFRTAARDQYGIEVRPSRVTLCSHVTCNFTCNVTLPRVQGDECEDWALGLLCGACVTCQTAAEHEERKAARN